MLKPVETKVFRRQYRLMKRRGWNINTLIEVMTMIINEQPLPPEREDHPLHGEWKGTHECHIQGDFISALR